MKAPCTERYARCCERTAANHRLLLDYSDRFGHAHILRLWHCASLGFEMDCGHAFGEKYGNAANNVRNLKRIIDSVDDIMLLGSALYSRWRYFNHWAYSGAEILESDNRAWFITALDRLIVLTENDRAETENSNRFLNQHQKLLQKAQIISDLICYGPCPAPRCG